MNNPTNDSGSFDRFEGELRNIVRATPEKADWPLDRSITHILRLVREQLGMDVVFVAMLTKNFSIITRADSVSPDMNIEGSAYPRSESFCQRVLDGRLPAVIPDVESLRSTHDVPTTPIPVGSYMSAPVWLQDGSLYGMLCCLSAEASPGLNASHYKRLEMSARLIAQLIDAAAGRRVDLHVE